MRGSIAQLVALVTHGNLFLGGGGSAPDLHPGNTTFKYVRRLSFDGREQGTAEWFEGLRDRGVSRLSLRLPVVDDPATTAFAHVADESICATGDGRDIWTATWAFVGESWVVSYDSARATSAPDDGPSLADARDNLAEVLPVAEDLASTNGSLAPMACVLRDARDRLSSAAPELAYHPDAVPGTWPLEARQLLAAAFQG